MSKLVWYDCNPAAGILQARYTPPAPTRTTTLPTFTWHTNTGKEQEPKGYIEVRQRRPKRPRQLEGSGAVSVRNDEGGEVLAVPLSAHAVDLLDVNKYLYRSMVQGPAPQGRQGPLSVHISLIGRACKSTRLNS